MPDSTLSRLNGSRFILIGEDDPDDQVLLEDIFTKVDREMALLFVNSGIEIINTLEMLPENHHPCLLVLDYNMPGLNGSEILKLINSKEQFMNIPKILWSTSDSERYRSVCLQLGAVDYIIKPSSINELERIARYMLSVCESS